MAAGFTARARGRAGWRLWVVLLSVTLISLATLAKRSFSLPRASTSHWISQTCKIRESRRVSPVRAICSRAAVPVLPSRPSRLSLRVSRAGDPPLRIVDFFSSTALRSPPLFV